MTMPLPSSPDHLRRALRSLAKGDDLAEDEARAVFTSVMLGDVLPADIATLLLALRSKGATAPEVAGVARALRDAMRTVSFPHPDRLVDTCGTGGGALKTLNISTAAAFVVAGCGIPVAKHGNRSYTSRSGSADVLEALGIAIDAEPARATRILAEAGIAFLFAPIYHPAMRHVASIRRELGVATVMNLVGPLANPARAARQVVGVADPGQGALMAATLLRLGARHAMVVHGEIGIDEIAPVGPTRVWEVRNEAVEEWTLVPGDYGIAPESLHGLEGGEPGQNAAAIEALLRHPGRAPLALRSAVILNAAGAIRVSRDGVNMHDAVAEARASLDEGAALARLERLRSVGGVSTSE